MSIESLLFPLVLPKPLPAVLLGLFSISPYGIGSKRMDDGVEALGWVGRYVG